MGPIDNKLLRSFDGPGCIAYFRSLQQNGLSEQAITAHLLAAVQSQSVPPVPVMSVWLSFAQVPATLKTALNQTFSRRTRKFALKGFRRLLYRARWRLLWTEFGSIAGILDLFSRLSLGEINLVTSIIGHQIKPGRDLERDAAITDLLRALLRVDDSDIMHKNPDRRHLVGKYLQMLPACSASFVEEMLCQPVKGKPDHVWELKHFRPHSAMIIRLTAESAFGSGRLSEDFFADCLSFCLKNLQQGYKKDFGCSMSMSFALELVRRLAAEESRDLRLDKHLQEVFNPVMKPSWKRRRLLGASRLAGIVQSAVLCVSRRPKAAVSLSTNPAGLLSWVISCWSLTPEILANTLRMVLERFSTQLTVGNITGMAKSLLQVVEVDLRYRLLHMLFSSIPGSDIDIDSVSVKTSNNIWDHELFIVLPRKDAVPLLERLRQIKPELTLSLPYGSSSMLIQKTIFVCPATPLSYAANTDMLYHFLRRGQEGALESASKFLTYQKQKAMTSREQTDRAFFARASLFAAVASGSLPLLKNTVIWLRRYIRDPLTVKTLFNKTTFSMTELVELLAGVPQLPSKQEEQAGIAEAVSEGNAIMRELYKTTVEALHEPSFNASDWEGPLSIFRLVIEMRLDRVKLLQRVLQLSDEQLYDCVWRDTLQLLVKIEESAIEEGHAGLNYALPSGPLCYSGRGYTPTKKGTPASYRFVDELARVRETMWQASRRQKIPAVAALPDPWPRGLAIQHLLTSLDMAEPSAKGHTSYLTARAKSIVFTPSAQALARIPADKDSENAVGFFVNDYEVAIKIYIQQESSPEARKELLQKAWTYAIQSFGREPMTADERIRYVNAVFDDFFSKDPLVPSSVDHAKLRLYPILPEEADDVGINEWDPSTAKPRDIESKTFDPRVIDCMFSNYKYWSKFSAIQASIPGWSADPIWSLGRFKPGRVRREQREALILSRLLYLDSKIGGKSGLLDRPFPSTEDARYPALFLDADFLLRDDLGELDLSSFTAHIPVDLVRRLADKAMSQLLLEEDPIKNADGVQEDAEGKSVAKGTGGKDRDPEQPSTSQESNTAAIKSRTRILELERILYDLVAFLAVSDKPQLAADLSLRIILERPGASSWHRKLLDIKYLQGLPSADVQVCFSDFTQALSERLAEQDAHKDDKEWKGPYVKTTTLKHVAQLLHEAEFISRIDAVDILVKLYNQAKHVDVRVAAVESLLGMLTPCKDGVGQSVANAVIEGLKATIPLIGGPSERREITEQDWLAAETTGIPPEVREDTPIATLLIKAVAGHGSPIDMQHRRTIMSDILLPALDVSARRNERWVKLFAAQHSIFLGASKTHKYLLAYPIKPALITSLLLLAPRLTPEYVLQRYHDHILALLSPPSDLAALKDKISDDLDLRTSNSGKTFLSLFNHSLQDHSAAAVHLSLVRVAFHPSFLPTDGIELKTVQTMLCALTTPLITTYADNPLHFDTFINHLRPPLGLSPSSTQLWTTNIKPVLESLLSALSSARSQLTPPAILPSTFPLTLSLLPWPSTPSLPDTALPTALLSLLAHLPTPLYHPDFLALQRKILQLPSVAQHVEIALALESQVQVQLDSSDQTRSSTLCRALVAELQEALLVGVAGKTVSRVLLAEVEALAGRWIMSGAEETRRRGYAVRRAVKGAVGTGS